MIRDVLVALVGRRPVTAAFAIAFVFVVGAATAIAAAHRGPRLVLTSLSGSPVQLAPGSRLTVSFTEKNIGNKPARVSTTGFYLSASAKLDGGAIHLGGAARVKALRPRQNVRGKALLAVPKNTAPGAYFLIGCSNDRANAKKSGTRSCRAARGHVTVTTGGGGGGAVTCVPTDTPTLTSQDPKCFDGDAVHGIFVSTLGNDASPGTMAAPMRTLAAGEAAAFAQRKDVYVTRGDFNETLLAQNGVSVYGGYDTSWQRSPANITKITGTNGIPWAAVADGILTQTTLQLLTLAPPRPTIPGESSYGLVGDGSPRLTLDRLTIAAQPGVAGSDGLNGIAGRAGGDANGFHGGTSPVGHNGGDGGAHGTDGPGGPGAPGLPTTPDSTGRMGGPGGIEGFDGHTAGAAGSAGDSGGFLGDGAGGTSGNHGSSRWLSGHGADGLTGTDGDGGGGGGGGGADTNLFHQCDGGTGGGGGGGGERGGGGTGGQGGGGSFGIFLVNSSGAIVRDSSVTASNGGAGGAGAGGALGGAGGQFAPGFPPGNCGAPGGHGGLGGVGGRGGDGGGGAGGPSVAIFGLSASNAPGTTVHHGSGGAGGAGGIGSGNGGGKGADGAAADYL